MERICPYCMNVLSEETSCPNCGKDPGTYRPASHHFPPGTLLHARYRLGRVLGEGGFGITYLGWDTELERRVAVKEYFPTAFVKRETSLTLDVTCYTQAGLSYYEKGREQFLKEARTMAKLEKIPEIVRVLDFFQAHNTAYIVMEFLEGETLKDMTARQGRVPAGELLELLRPVMGAMAAMHRAGVIHRDISPDNLMCLPSGKVKLMDFGCAKEINGGRTMTVTLKHGFAPFEQYAGRGQGPWSDLYSLCATIYYCLTGRVPPDAMERDGGQDPLVPPSQLGSDLTPGQERALLRGLACRAEDRWQSMEELYGALYGVNLDGTPWKEPRKQEQKGNEGKTEYVESTGKEEQGEPEGVSFDDRTSRDAPPAPKKKRISKGAMGAAAACCALVIIAAAALGGGLLPAPGTGPDQGGGSAAQSADRTGIPSGSASGESGGQGEQEQTAGELLPGLLEETASGSQGTAEQDPAASQGEQTAGDGQTSAGGTQSAGQQTKPTQQTQPTQETKPSQQTQPTQPTQSTQQTAPPAQTEPEEPPVPTKAELEAQAEAAVTESRYSDAVSVYREMNALGYISSSKLAICLDDVAGAAENEWYETDYGNNSSPLIKLAFELYVEAANMGSGEAMGSVAYCYDYGHYVQQNSTKACEWWTKLANTGDGPACYFVAQYYADGTGVPQDTQKAIQWLNKCFEYGASYVASDAQELLDELQGGG